MKHKFFYVVIVVFIVIIQPLKIISQSHIDTLKEDLVRASGEEEIPILINLTKSYWEISPKKSVEFGESAFELSKKYSNRQGATTALLYTAVAKYYIGEYDSCIDFSKKAIEIAPESRLIPTKSFAFNMISISYKSSGDYNKALKYALQSYKIRISSTDTVNIAGSLDNISHIYLQMGNYEQALKYSLKALTLFEKMFDTLDEAKTLGSIANLYLDLGKTELSMEKYKAAEALLLNYQNTITNADIQCNVGVIYLKAKEYDTALRYFKTALLLYESNGVIEGVSEVYLNMGLCYIGKQQPNKALKYLSKAYIYCKSSTDKNLLAQTEKALGNAFLQIGQVDSAGWYLRHSLLLAKKINNVATIMESLDAMSTYYEKTGDHQQSLNYFKQYIRYHDSIQGQQMKLRLAELQTKYETSKKEKKILSLQIIEETEKRKNHDLIFMLIFSFIVFATILTIIIIKSRNERIYYKHQKIIAEKNDKIVKAKMEKNLLVKKQLEKDIRFKTKQLGTQALNILQKSKILQDISSTINKILETDCVNQKSELNQLKTELLHDLKADKDWNLFKIYFEEVNNDFISKLRKIHPNITENETRLTILIKLNMNTKEIASILNISPNSVKNARHRLKIRLKLKPEQDLNSFIEKSI